MTGQDAIKSAGEFNRRIGVTGVVLTKLDGDARGGAALSVVSVVGVPVAFIGSGERLEDLELFHPDRIVSRILGMGDVLSLIEKAEQAIGEDEAEKLEEKLRKNQFSLDDFRTQLRTLKRMGPLESILGMIPGLGNLKELAAEQAGRKAAGARGGDHLVDDAGRASQRPDHQRQPPQAHRRRERHVGRGRQPAAQAVRRDEARAADDRARRDRRGEGHEGHAEDRSSSRGIRDATGGGKKRKKGGPWGLIKSR